MKLIIGLGNPGGKYEKTRHNTGFMVLEKFLKDFEKVEQTQWMEEPKFKSSIVKIQWQPKTDDLEKIILAKPKTFMNNSGIAVSLISQYLNIPISNIWVIHDDIDLPLGSMRIRFGGSSGGHKGVESIIETLGTEKFWRFRMGIGRQDQRLKIKDQRLSNKEVENYVLSKFSGQEWGKAKHMIKKGAKAIEAGLEDGLEKAMNEFNTR